MPLTWVFLLVFFAVCMFAMLLFRLLRPMFRVGAELDRAHRQAKRQIAEHLAAQARAPHAIQVQGSTRSVRCPYCHTDVDEADVVACASCLARHHEGCWDEHRECSSCGAVERFTQVERTAGRERPNTPKPEKQPPSP
ncbi:MAG: hypothetical protein KDD82_04375 [Planctomycetes bacterium]|nr:hypothetical protein [Planctomycetota bacterium]